MRKDGSRFCGNVVVTALRESEGTLLGFGKLTRDLTERREAEEKIRKQGQEIMDMATVPMVQVWDGVMLVPFFGTLDGQRTQQPMERLLQRISETGSPAEVILTGVPTSIAQTLVHLGIDLSNVITRSSLTAGLRMALGILNLGVVPRPLAGGD